MVDNVADVGVRLVLDTSGVKRDIEKGVRGAASTATRSMGVTGTKAGQALGVGVASGLGSSKVQGSLKTRLVGGFGNAMTKASAATQAKAVKSGRVMGRFWGLASAGAAALAYKARLSTGVPEASAKAGKAGGNRFTKGLVSGTAAVGRVMKRTLVGAGLVAGAAAVGAIGKGFGRLTSIEDAQAKMKGLGFSTKQVEGIMKNTLASVKGTAFGLDEGAKSAAALVTAGLKPGKQLEGTLKAVSNSAAAAGTGMEYMGQLFAEVAAKGAVSNDVLTRMTELGIPIRDKLAKQLGVTRDEVTDLASKGKISFKEFKKAAESASGSVADEMGKTVTGRLRNFGAAVSRVGAAFLSGGGKGGVFGMIGPALKGMTGWIDKATPAAGKLGQGFAKLIGGIGKSFSKGSPIIDGFKEFGAAVSSPTAIKALKTIGGFIKPLGPAFQDFGVKIQEVIGPALAEVGTVIGTTFLPALANIMPVLAPIGGFLLKLFGGAVLGVIKGFFTAVKGALTLIAGIFNTVAAAVKGDWSGMWEGVKQILSGALTLIVGIFQVAINVGIVKVLRALPKIVWGLFKLLMKGAWALLKGGWKLIQSLFKASLNALRTAVSGGLKKVLTFFKELPGKIKSGLGSLKDLLVSKGKQLVTGLVNGIKAAPGKIKDAVLSLLPGPLRKLAKQLGIESPSKVTKGFGEMIGAGLIEGIASMYGGVGKATEGLADRALSGVPGEVSGVRGNRNGLGIGGNLNGRGPLRGLTAAAPVVNVDASSTMTETQMKRQAEFNAEALMKRSRSKQGNPLRLIAQGGF